ncbi:hypothetical protein C427_1112 [Paraglaciecola psychrophila 170]|jgi:hypothetical protein|uniref:Uncharacterized protein n=1 Tax=Paraglaciecola psychrophila 170 TaxID=1129794 RepID=K6ZLW3_9ALTE|nr:hypothetical protein C427_1112 [Paraglaciecola psychrophila 170]GAC36956.1 hypothetical protein GPSY_1321 [Paraglaciecola psychrophila 170]
MARTNSVDIWDFLTDVSTKTLEQNGSFSFYSVAFFYLHFFLLAL